MKSGRIFLIAVIILFGISVSANAALTTIGTANYLGSDYNLIYEDDNNGQELVWMDYTNDHANWENQLAWAEGLNSQGADPFS